MKGLNNYIPTYVHTQKGIKETKNLIPGDKVYQYRTGQMLEVKDVKVSEGVEINEVLYTDGRIQNLGENEKVIQGKIELYPLEFLPGHIKEPLYPDPYTAGALFGYGDFNDKYLNLPADMDFCNNVIAHKYNLDYGDKLGVNRVYFSYNDRPDTELITWKEFFNKYDFYAKKHKVADPPFPNEYVYASYANRVQFVRAIFDMGYDQTVIPDNIGIIHNDENRLKCIQRILWSLGIPSKIQYNPIWYDEMGIVHKYQYKRDWVLHVIGDKRKYPGFLYDLGKLEYTINNNVPLDKFDERFELRIKKRMIITKGTIANIVLEEPEMIYMDYNYLPRISI